MEQSVPISPNTPFLGPPFLKKGPLKITERGPFDPHWPISGINPQYLSLGSTDLPLYLV